MRRFTFVPDTYETLARMDPDPKGEWVKAPPGYLLVSEAELATALRSTGALWSANDYYEVTTDADEFAAAIFAALVAAQEKGA